MVQLDPVLVFGAKKIPVPFDGNFHANGKFSKSGLFDPLRACLHGAGGPRVGGVTRLSI